MSHREARDADYGITIDGDDRTTVLELVRLDATGTCLRRDGAWVKTDPDADEDDYPTIYDAEWVDASPEAIALFDLGLRRRQDFAGVIDDPFADAPTDEATSVTGVSKENGDITSEAIPSMNAYELANWSRVRSRARGLVAGYCLGDAIARAEPGATELVPGNAVPIALAALEGAIGARHRGEVKGHSAWMASGAWAGVVRWAASVGLTTIADNISGATWEPRWTASAPGFNLLRGTSVRGIREALGPVVSLDFSESGTGFISEGDHIVSRLVTIGVAHLRPFAADDDDVRWVVLGNARHSHSVSAQAYASLVSLMAHGAVTSGHLSTQQPVDRLVTSEHGGRIAGELAEASAHIAGCTARRSPDLHVQTSGPYGSARRTALAGTSMALLVERVGPSHALEVIAGARPSEAALAMGLTGAMFGIEALPQEQLARLELGWLADRLASDAIDLAERSYGLDPERYYGSDDSGHRRHTWQVFTERYHFS